MKDFFNYINTRMDVIANKEYSLDNSLMISIVMLVLGLFTGILWLNFVAAFFVFISLLHYRLIQPFVIIWDLLIALIGKYLSFAVLTLIYILVVIPVAFIRKIAAKDNLRIRGFRKNKDSVFVRREHIFNSTDFEKTF